MHRLNIRVRLGLFIFAIIIPVSIFISFNIINQYKIAKERSLASLTQIANIFSAEQSQTVEGARQLLISMSTYPSIRNLDSSSCDAFLRELIVNYKRYANFSVADENGDLICSAIPLIENINIKDREVFQKAFLDKRFAVGEYQIGQISKKPIINFGYPIINSNNKTVGIVISSLDLSWVNEFISSSSLEKGSIFQLLDKNGVILARSEDSEKWIGTTFPDSLLVKQVLDGQVITTDLMGVDNVRRLYVFKRLESVEKLPTIIVVGVPYNLIFEEAYNSLILSLISLFLTSAMAGFVSWKIGNLFLVKRIEALQELDRQKTEFVSTASHQLRTPLSGMKMFLEILMGGDYGNLNKKQAEIAKNINDSNERMIGLVNSLLDVSKIELGKLNMNPEPVMLTEILQKVMNDLDLKVRVKKMRVTLVSNNDVVVTVDPKFISQVFSNLIDNAIKYSPQKGIINIKIYKKKDQAIIKVVDKGYGISEGEKKNIFQKFHRGSNLERQDMEGNGLGLYIAKSIVEESHGSISFTSKKNKGTTFTVTLPLFMA